MQKLNDQHFAFGFRRNQEPVSFSVLPLEGIITEEPIPSGTYIKPPVVSGFGYDVYPYYLLGFFDKQEIRIRPATTSSDDHSSERELR